ncbi:regulator of chromosome condensation 1/beta-lactamase-inhibitor protein II, partial [Suillus tomentosus]
DDGQVWSVGANNLGQCGHPVTAQSTFEAIEGPFLDGERLHVIKAAVGITFSIILTDDSGKVFSFGSGEKGQLGNGRTGEHIITGNKTVFDIETEPGLDEKTIIDIACRPQHSVALDSQGLVYVWGYNGYCQLGLGNQQDVLIPKVVPNVRVASVVPHELALK